MDDTENEAMKLEAYSFEEEEEEHIDGHTDDDDIYAFAKRDVSKFPHQTLVQDTLLSVSSSRQDPSQILPFLFLGNWPDSRDELRLRELYITNFVDCCARIDANIAVNDYGGSSLHIAAVDDDAFNISQYFVATSSFIHQVKEKSQRVLVYCQAGMSRSPSIVAAYLIMKMGLTLDEAMYILEKRRPYIQPNMGFMEQLKQLEKSVQM